MVGIWGGNYSLMKRAFRDMAPLAFNALRLSLGSALLLAAIRYVRRVVLADGGTTSSTFYTDAPLTPRDRWTLVWLGLVGHTGYQLCFAQGVSLTSASNGALIIGVSPIAVGLASAAIGHERLSGLHWLGVLLSAVGVGFVVGHGASFGGGTWRGDLLMLLAVLCWTAYTIGGGQLMARHSPLYVTGVTMAIGTVPYVLLAIPSLWRTDWAAVSAFTWGALVVSAALALAFCYIVWYAGVRTLGPSRTAIYSNVIPIVAIVSAAAFLHEPLTGVKIAGAAAVLAGVLLTRRAARKQA
jgi:drug/metabolite transporter (DMT)-like permease